MIRRLSAIVAALGTVLAPVVVPMTMADDAQPPADSNPYHVTWNDLLGIEATPKDPNNHYNIQWDTVMSSNPSPMNEPYVIRLFITPFAHHNDPKYAVSCDDMVVKYHRDQTVLSAFPAERQPTEGWNAHACAFGYHVSNFTNTTDLDIYRKSDSARIGGVRVGLPASTQPGDSVITSWIPADDLTSYEQDVQTYLDTGNYSSSTGDPAVDLYKYQYTRSGELYGHTFQPVVLFLHADHRDNYAKYFNSDGTLGIHYYPSYYQSKPQYQELVKKHTFTSGSSKAELYAPKNDSDGLWAEATLGAHFWFGTDDDESSVEDLGAADVEPSNSITLTNTIDGASIAPVPYDLRRKDSQPYHVGDIVPLFSTLYDAVNKFVLIYPDGVFPLNTLLADYATPAYTGEGGFSGQPCVRADDYNAAQLSQEYQGSLSPYQKVDFEKIFSDAGLKLRFYSHSVTICFYKITKPIDHHTFNARTNFSTYNEVVRNTFLSPGDDMNASFTLDVEPPLLNRPEDQPIRVTVAKGQTVNAKQGLPASVTDDPNVERLEITKAADTSRVGDTEQDVVIHYHGTHVTRELHVPVTVKDRINASLIIPVPSGDVIVAKKGDVIAYKGDKVDPQAGLTKVPEDAKVTVVKPADTSKVGDTTQVVKVTFHDGSSHQYTIPVTVKDRINASTPRVQPVRQHSEHPVNAHGLAQTGAAISMIVMVFTIAAIAAAAFITSAKAVSHHATTGSSEDE